jgi:hypothetical protein
MLLTEASFYRKFQLRLEAGDIIAENDIAENIWEADRHRERRWML